MRRRRLNAPRARRSPTRLPTAAQVKYAVRIFPLRLPRNRRVISSASMNLSRFRGNGQRLTRKHTNEREVRFVSKNEERYLLQALEFEGALRAYLHRYAGAQSDVEDLLQETYARLLVAATADPSEVRSIRTLALGIARAVAEEWLQQTQGNPVRGHPELATGELDDPDGQVEEIVRRRQELARLVTSIQGLPGRCRQVLTLRKVYGYSPAQIASRLDIPAQSVAADLTQAVRRCAEAIFGPRTIPPPRTWLDRFRIRSRAHEQSG